MCPYAGCPHPLITADPLLTLQVVVVEEEVVVEEAKPTFSFGGFFSGFGKAVNAEPEPAAAAPAEPEPAKPEPPKAAEKVVEKVVEAAAPPPPPVPKPAPPPPVRARLHSAQPSCLSLPLLQPVCLDSIQPSLLPCTRKPSSCAPLVQRHFITKFFLVCYPLLPLDVGTLLFSHSCLRVNGHPPSLAPHQP